MEACRALPRRTELAAARRRARRDGALACKQALRELCHDSPAIANVIAQRLDLFNGTVDDPASFDRLHRLLEAQAYRLAYWLVATDEINYRRFFDINDLAGIRIDRPEVFEETHRLIRRLFATGRIDGLRIDHPDGLSDPYGYFCSVQRLIAEARPEAQEDHGHPGYLVVEKILASHERLPRDWPVAGTTGYEVAHLINGLMIDPAGEHPLDRIYRRFTGHRGDFEDLLYRRKKLIMRTALAGELSGLANLAVNIARGNRHSRDFTYLGLRDALAEIVACFPVYRTYLTRGRASEHDHRHLTWAVAQAKQRSPAKDVQVFDYLAELLSLRPRGRRQAGVGRRLLQLVLRFQQYTAPVMAKGLEDTALYAYNRLLPQNDVGFDPRHFGISCEAFHQENQQRLLDWPHALTSTSTHDSKRSEDVRARLDVLSELPEEWGRHLARWRRVNRAKRRLLGNQAAPSPNDEYLLYQTLLGTWPLETLDDAGLASYRERITAYMLKAVKEAKVHSSWLNPNAEYEAAIRHFVAELLSDPARSPFIRDFRPLQEKVTRLGLLNGLSQTLLKLTVPGVPDIYQGNELWTFELVDPDNRRPVEFPRRATSLQALQSSKLPLAELLAELLQSLEDDRAKLYLTWRALQLRQSLPRLFAGGDYQGLTAFGTRHQHVCAFARSRDGDQVVVAVGRWFAALSPDPDTPPVGPEVWADTLLECPPGAGETTYRNILSNDLVRAEATRDGPVFPAASLFRHFPVALLSNR
jgi:(1->4)-alpha-D-glucan 1-alpha-D-glucosylmutase